MGNRQDVAVVLSIVDNNFFKTLANVDSTLKNTIKTSNQVYESLDKLSSVSVNPQDLDSFIRGGQEAANLFEQLEGKLKRNFTPIINSPNFSEMVAAANTMVQNINESLKKFHVPNLGKLMAGDESIFATINSNINKATASFGGMAQSFGDKQKQMISGMSNWKTNLSGFTENTKYQMKLFTMAMRTEGSPVDKLGKAFDSVSAKATSGFSKIYQSSGMVGSSFQKIGEGVNKANSYVAGLSENARYQMKLFSTHIRSEHPAITELGSKFSEMSSQVGGTISNVASKFGGLGSKFTDMVTNSNALKSVFGGIGSTLQSSASIGTTAMTSMVQGLTSVMGFALKALGPAAILGVALVGFGLLDGQMGEQLSSMIETATTKGPELIAGFVQGIVDKLPALMETGTQLVAGLVGAISANLPTIMQSAILLLNTLVQGVIDSLPTLIPAALMLIESLATSLLEAAPQLLLTGLNLLISLVDGIMANKDQIIDTVTKIIESFTTQITNNLPMIIDKGIELLVKLAEGIASMLPELIPVALKAITTLVKTLADNLPKLLDAAVEIVGKLCEGLLDNLPAILAAAVELILAIVLGIGESLPKIAAAGAKIMLKLLETVWKSVPDLKDAGKNLIQGLIDGIGGMARAALDAVLDIGKSIGDTFKNIFKIHSPSRWMRDEIGAMLPAGLAIGIEANAHTVDQAMDDLTSRIMLPALDEVDNRVASVQEYSLQSNYKQSVDEPAKQPATFNIRLGNQQFKAFVGDISEAMGRESEINLAF